MPAPGQPPAPVFEPGAAYPELARMRAALGAGDWPGVRQIIGGLDWAGISIFTGLCGDLEGTEEFLRAVVARQPADPVAATMLASTLIRTGWRVRTAHRAQHVSREQFARFHEYLRQAERALIQVTARHPDYVTAWYLRITAARGLELGESEARRRYDRLARHQPHHQPAQSSLLQKLCPKWSGTWEGAHGFARECLRTAPPGSCSPVVVVEGHLEHALDLGGVDDATGYLRTPQVWQEIHEAAQRSVWNPAFRHGPGWVLTRSTFALAFSLAGEWPAAAGQFAALGPYGDDWMWDYLPGDPAEQFREYRAEAYAKGGPR
ncbi:hypothetical protein AB0H57_09295 [Micromonospora sp. NPDC050686]|uniref:tetratricopeptide repeat protein n=1 Tax=Micromonospora sp. NPDC050686 TaxID=3154631 RepID=UPI0033CA0955